MSSPPEPRPVTPISVVCSDLSENCLGRAQVLAEVLAGFGEVRIVGPQLGASLWRPAASSHLAMSGLPLRSASGYAKARSWLRSQLAGSRVVVSKPRSTSFGLALWAGVKPTQMLLDIDDWELGFKLPQLKGALGRAAFASSTFGELLAPRSLNSFAAIRWLDKACFRVPRRSVSNSWLAERFGGVVLPHVRDTTRLDPQNFEALVAQTRLQQGLNERPWVGFVGTIREHKGVEDLVSAVAGMTDANAPGLLLAGVDREHAFSKTVLSRAEALLPPERLRLVPAFDAAELPAWVGAVDVICIPSRDIPGSWGQIPAKLFDAMALGKAIVCSSINDTPGILDGCGLVFPAGDVLALGARLQELTSSPEQRAQLGAAARSRAIARFSVQSGRHALAALVDQLPTFLPSG